jgi:hypothetical protein
MPETGYPLSPTVLRGALVQLLEDFGAIVPNVVPFQYNPAKMTLGIAPWNPFQTSPQNQASQSPLVQPFDPEQTFSFDLEFDATDDIERGDPLARMTGVAPRLAALRKLVEPSKGLVGDLVGAVGALTGDPATRLERPEVPVTLLVLGTSAILPVRITSMSVEIEEFTPDLHPLMAKASLGLRVLTPDVFRCRSTTASALAVAAYNLTRAQESALAIANVAYVGRAAASMVPL